MWNIYSECSARVNILQRDKTHREFRPKAFDALLFAICIEMVMEGEFLFLHFDDMQFLEMIFIFLKTYQKNNRESKDSLLAM